MDSPRVASPAAANNDLPGRYPAAKPATAATVPQTSASPNRARHARHHRRVPAALRRPAGPHAGSPLAAPPQPASPRTASAQPAAVSTFMLVPRIPGTGEGRLGDLEILLSRNYLFRPATPSWTAWACARRAIRLRTPG